MVNVSSIINDIFGGDETDEVTSGVKSEEQTGTVIDNIVRGVDSSQSTSRGTVTESLGTETREVQQDVRNIDAESEAALKQVLGKITGGYKSSDLSQLDTRIKGRNNEGFEIAKFLAERAKSADAVGATGIDAVLKQARATAQKDRDARFAQNTRTAGTAFSSVVQKQVQSDTNSLETGLAATEYQLRQDARQRATQELLGSFGALDTSSKTTAQTESAIPALMAEIDATRTNSIAALADVLKGAVTSTSILDTLTSANRVEQQETTNTIGRIDETSTSTKDINSTTNSITAGNREIDESPSIFSILDKLDEGD